MKFTLTIELGNEAMQTGDDLQTAMAQVCGSLYLPMATIMEPIGPVPVRDGNGNTVGSWAVTQTPAEEAAENTNENYGRVTTAAELMRETAKRIEATAQDTDADGLPPDPENLNERRAEAALSAVQAFAEDMGELPHTGGLDDESNADLLAQNVADLLCNLAHLGDRHGFDLAACWERAAGHYMAETENQGEQMITLPK